MVERVAYGDDDGVDCSQGLDAPGTFFEVRAVLAGEAAPGAAGHEMQAIGIPGALQMAVGAYVAPGKRRMPARPGARVEEVDPVNFG